MSRYSSWSQWKAFDIQCYMPSKRKNGFQIKIIIFSIFSLSFALWKMVGDFRLWEKSHSKAKQPFNDLPIKRLWLTGKTCGPPCFCSRPNREVQAARPFFCELLVKHVWSSVLIDSHPWWLHGRLWLLWKVTPKDLFEVYFQKWLFLF